MLKDIVKVLALTPHPYSYGDSRRVGEAGFSVDLMKLTPKTSIASLPSRYLRTGLYSALHALKFKEWITNPKFARKKPIVLGESVTQVPEPILINMSSVDAVILDEGEEPIPGTPSG